jgi:hypothetical protein
MKKVIRSGITLTLSQPTQNVNEPKPNSEKDTENINLRSTITLTRSTATPNVKKTNTPNVKNTKPNSKKERDKMDLRSSIMHQLETSTYECVICYDSIKTRDPIWNCNVNLKRRLDMFQSIAL